MDISRRLMVYGIGMVSETPPRDRTATGTSCLIGRDPGSERERICGRNERAGKEGAESAIE